MTIMDGYILVAIVGNPNVGKSTIFNILTNSNQNVGNYPGVTVEKKECVKNCGGYAINFVDLPGVYSLCAFSDDEKVTRNFLLKENPDVIINVIDASNLERNLYLFTQLTELNVPAIVVLNMVDILKSQGKTIDKKTMSDLLRVPVFTTVASKKIGVDEILDSVVAVYKNKKKQTAARVDYGEDIKAEIDKLENLISKNRQIPLLPKNWLAIKLLENDLGALKLVADVSDGDKILSQLKKSRDHIKEHFNEESEMEMVGKRYGFVNSVSKTVVAKTEKRKIDITEIIDAFAINRYLGIPIFALAMYVIFKFTFTLSDPVVKLFGLFFEVLGRGVSAIIAEGPIKSLIVDGIIGGIGGVLGFFPLVLCMFFMIAFFEDSGYMARAAFVMDKIMSRFGLCGKSFLPLMISINGCALPGILATRSLDSKRDRLITMFIVPFMICGAKLPIFALIIGAFFPSEYKTSIMFFMYLLSVVIALSVAKILSKTALKEKSSHFVIELPAYSLPTMRGLLLKMWERGLLYIKKAGTTIVLISIIMWAAFTYPKVPVDENLSAVERAEVQLQHSFAGRVGYFLSPLFKPIGMDGNKVVALIAGFAAKEAIVSVLGTIYSIGDVDGENNRSLKDKIASDKDWSPLKGMTFLIFCLIYTPCIVSVTGFFKETDSSYKWLTLLVGGSALLAWLSSFIIFRVGTFLKIGV